MSSDCGPRAVPPFGWHYPEESDGEPIKADSFDKLIDAVTQHRLNNKKTMGDPAYDIRAYVSKHWPQHIGSVSIARPKIEEENPLVNQRERVRQWIANRYALRAGGHTTLVDQETVEARAKICSTCPQNQAYRNDCPPCVEELKRTKFLLTQGETTGFELKACAITGQDNEPACFLPSTMLRHADKYQDELAEKAPHCWLLNN